LITFGVAILTEIAFCRAIGSVPFLLVGGWLSSFYSYSGISN